MGKYSWKVFLAVIAMSGVVSAAPMAQPDYAGTYVCSDSSGFTYTMKLDLEKGTLYGKTVGADGTTYESMGPYSVRTTTTKDGEQSLLFLSDVTYEFAVRNGTVSLASVNGPIPCTKQ